MQIASHEPPIDFPIAELVQYKEFEGETLWIFLNMRKNNKYSIIYKAYGMNFQA